MNNLSIHCAKFISFATSDYLQQLTIFQQFYCLPIPNLHLNLEAGILSIVSYIPLMKCQSVCYNLLSCQFNQTDLMPYYTSACSTRSKAFWYCNITRDVLYGSTLFAQPQHFGYTSVIAHVCWNTIWNDFMKPCYYWWYWTEYDLEPHKQYGIQSSLTYVCICIYIYIYSTSSL